MSTRLELVADRNAEQTAEEPVTDSTVPVFVPQPRAAHKPPNALGRLAAKLRGVVLDERGAVTAEYAIIVVAAVL